MMEETWASWIIIGFLRKIEKQKLINYNQNLMGKKRERETYRILKNNNNNNNKKKTLFPPENNADQG